MRHVLACIKQQKDEFMTVSKISWIPNQLILADVLTKNGVKTDPLLAAVTKGQLES